MLDYNMPGMSGLNGLKKTLAHGGGQRVALISGITESVAEEALAIGALGLFPKRFRQILSMPYVSWRWVNTLPLTL